MRQKCWEIYYFNCKIFGNRGVIGGGYILFLRLGILLNMSRREQVKKCYNDFEKENKILIKQISSTLVIFSFNLPKMLMNVSFLGTNLGLKWKTEFPGKQNVVSC